MSKTLCHTTGDLSDIRLLPSGRKSFSVTRAAAKILPGYTAYVNGAKLTGNATADATATASDILPGKTAYVNGAKLTGNSAEVLTSDATAMAEDIKSGATAYVKGAKIAGNYVEPSLKVNGAVASNWHVVANNTLSTVGDAIVSLNGNTITCTLRFYSDHSTLATFKITLS